MSELRKWRDSDDAPEDLRRLFAAGRPTRGMSNATRSRIARRIGAPVAGAAAATYVLTWKAVAVAAVIGAAVTTGVVTAARVMHPASDDHAVAVASRPTAHALGLAPTASCPDCTEVPLPTAPVEINPLATLPVTEKAAPAPSPAPSTPSTVIIEAPVSTPKEDPLAAELALIDKARASFESDPSGTLTLLAEHARRFPAGRLSIERELLALDALKRLGRRSEEHDRADRLLPRVRGTIYEQRVRGHVQEAASP